MCGAFIIGFVLLTVVHPAFRFAKTPAVVLLAFLLLFLASIVSVVVVGKFDRMMRRRKQLRIGLHEEEGRLAGTLGRAIDLGISNMRRRPFRFALTALTVVLVPISFSATVSPDLRSFNV